MQGQSTPQNIFFPVSLRNHDLNPSYGQMTICRRPNCDRAAADRALGFCAEDHAAYLRSRQDYAALAKAAQIVHASTFAIVPTAQRQMLAEYLVAVASEDLPAVAADVPRSAALLAAALIARGRSLAPHTSSAYASRRAAARSACGALGAKRR